MRYYIYVSKMKIDMMYEQIIGKNAIIEETTKAGINAHLISGESSRKVVKSDSIYTRLDKIIRNLNETGAVGNVGNDGNFISGTLTLSWNIDVYGLNAATFWIGTFFDSKGIECRLLLFGSHHHILGYEEMNASMTYTYLSSFLECLMRNIPNDFMKIKDTYVFRDIPYLINTLINYFVGEVNEYEFVAKKIYSELLFEPQIPNLKPVRYIVATPLYVAMNSLSNEKIIINDGMRKCRLSIKEYQKFQRHNFQGLHMVLQNAKLNAQSKYFYNDLKNLSYQYKMRFGMLGKKDKAKFRNEAKDIIERYFYIES